MVITFALALSSGWLFFQVNMPAPYLMGSLFGVWLAGGLLRPIQPYLGVARWFHIPVILGLSVMIGATFGQDLFHEAILWWKSLCVMMVTTLIVCMAGYHLLTRWRGYEKRLAFFCSLPGGLYEVTLLALIFGFDVAFVAFHHTVRIIPLFFAMSFIANRLPNEK